MLQEAPLVRLAPQLLLLTAKSPAFVPLIKMEPIAIEPALAALVVLVRVRVSELVVETVTVPKVNEVGLAV